MSAGTLPAATQYMSVYEHLLIATDFSNSAESASRLGASLAKRLAARVTLFTVQRQTTTLAALDRMASEIDAEGIQTALVDGDDRAGAIVSYANDHDVDLIIVGTRGRTGLKAFAMGSVAERVLRHARCSVLVARGDGALPTRILVATDLSAPSQRGVQVAVELAPLCSAGLELVHVHVPPSVLSLGKHHAHVPAHAVAAEFHEQLKAISARHRGLPLHEEFLTDAHPASKLISYAAEHDVHLMVVGAHGHSAIERMLVGSVSERVVRHAPCSVLVVR